MAQVRITTLVIAAVLVVSCARGAGEDPGGVVPGASRPTVRVQPLALYMTPGGRIIFPGEARGGVDIDVEMINVASPRLTPGVEVGVESDRWHVRGSFLEFSTRDRGAVSPVSRPIGDMDLRAGDEIVSSLDFSWIEGRAGYRLVDASVPLDGRERAPVRGTIDALAGVRGYTMRMEVQRRGGGRASAARAFAEPIVGVGLGLELREEFRCHAEATFGWLELHTKHTESWSIQLGVEYTPTDSVGFSFGYRIVDFDLDEGRGPGAFEYRGSLAGLYAGVVLRF